MIAATSFRFRVTISLFLASPRLVCRVNSRRQNSEGGFCAPKSCCVLPTASALGTPAGSRESHFGAARSRTDPFASATLHPQKPNQPVPDSYCQYQIICWAAHLTPVTATAAISEARITKSGFFPAGMSPRFSCGGTHGRGNLVRQGRGLAWHTNGERERTVDKKSSPDLAQNDFQRQKKPPSLQTASSKRSGEGSVHRIEGWPRSPSRPP